MRPQGQNILLSVKKMACFLDLEFYTKMWAK